MLNGTHIRGDAGVFYADRPATGVIVKQLVAAAEHLALIRLDDGDMAWVPMSSLSKAL